MMINITRLNYKEDITMSEWMIDADHSVAAFFIRHMMIANVRGQFNKMSGFININEDDITKSSMELTIDVASITTGIQKRDDHLRSADFFDVDKFPEMTFKSKSIVLTGINNAKITGDMTIHGVTNEIIFDVTFLGPVNSPFGETTMGFSAATEINREDFGMMWNEKMEKGEIMLGREVQIMVDLEADLKTD
jgi:polyisoprenoid-binding protein YceI